MKLTSTREVVKTPRYFTVRLTIRWEGRGGGRDDKDNEKDKDTDKVPEKPNICYIFEILMTYSFQI